MSSVTLIHAAKAVGRNEMPFGRETRVVPGNTVLDWGSGSPREGEIWGWEPPVRSEPPIAIITLAVVFFCKLTGLLRLYVKIWCQAGSDRDPVAMCVRLRDVLAAVREFVSSHPTELVAVHVTSGEGGGDWRASVDWKACQSVILEVLRDKLVPEHMRDMPLGNVCAQ